MLPQRFGAKVRRAPRSARVRLIVGPPSYGAATAAHCGRRTAGERLPWQCPRVYLRVPDANSRTTTLIDIRVVSSDLRASTLSEDTTRKLRPNVSRAQKAVLAQRRALESPTSCYFGFGRREVGRGTVFQQFRTCSSFQFYVHRILLSLCSFFEVIFSFYAFNHVFFAILSFCKLKHALAIRSFNKQI